MVNFESISGINLSQTEYCFLVGNQYYGNSRFNITIPKLMPNVTNTKTEPFNRNILVNAKECKPTVNNTLTVQNYISIPRSGQCSLYPKVINPETGIVPGGTGIICSCMNGNYKDMKIMDYI